MDGFFFACSQRGFSAETHPTRSNYQPQDGRRHQHDNHQPNPLQSHKRQRTLMNIERQLPASHLLQVKQRETYWWRDKRHVEIDRHHNTEPDHIDA